MHKTRKIFPLRCPHKKWKKKKVIEAARCLNPKNIIYTQNIFRREKGKILP